MFSTRSKSKIVKTDPYTRYGQCRCCLASGHHRDITKEYYFNNIREVYYDIFMECFNLALSSHKLLSTLICLKCIRRLREATSFRMMVLNTERQLLDEVNSENDQIPLFVDVSGPATLATLDIKTEDESVNDGIEPDVFMECVTEGIYEGEASEVLEREDSNVGDFEEENAKRRDSEEEEVEAADSEEGESEGGDSHTTEDVEFEGEDADGGDSEGEEQRGESEEDDADDIKQDYIEYESIKEEDIDPDDQVSLVRGEAGLLARFPKLEPLPTRHSLRGRCPKYVGHLEQLEGEASDKIVTPQSLEWFLEKPSSRSSKSKSSKNKNQIKHSLMSEKLANALNATTLFEHSNATAFKTKNRNGYPCFYCREIYDPEGLRGHQNGHSKSTLFKLFTKYSADELIVYADVTDLKCTICNKEIPSLADLKEHLTEVHNKKMFLDKPDRVIPFKLKDKDFECQVCGHYFETFGAVERHMNSHFGNFICEECGAGFITKHRLGVHSYVQHKHGNYVCTICNKYFQTPLKYRIHYDAVHKMLKKNKCPKCPEKFIDYFTRQKHLVDVHGDTPILYKCNVCDKAFNRKYTLSCHMKRTHLAQKDWKCEFCSYMCYTKTELRQHMVRHGANKEHECLICKRAYARKKALVMHMRIHTNDRRFICNVCGMAFVQKSTLNGHMKTHR